MKTFEGHFDLFKEKLQKGENFAFVRFSDGELFILENKRLELNNDHYIIGNQRGYGQYNEEERKKFDPETNQENRQLLINSLQHKQHNYYKGICCRCCATQEQFDFQINLAGGDSEFMTWANLFINSNYERFVKEFIPEIRKKKIIFVVNKSAELKLLKMDIVKDFRVGENCFINDLIVIDNIEKYVEENDIQNHLFLVSAASLTNLIIHRLFSKFPNNTYLDIGSTLNPLMKMEGWKGSRDYLREFWLNTPKLYLNKHCIW